MRRHKKTRIKKPGGRQKNGAQIPFYFADRVRKLCILSFFILFFGLFMGIAQSSVNLAAWSAVLGIWGLVKAFFTAREALAGEYEAVEGIVTGIQRIYPIGRLQRVNISGSDGRQTELLLDRGVRIRLWMTYRFYFRKKETALTGIRRIDAAFNTGSFYGFEEIDGLGGPKGK